MSSIQGLQQAGSFTGLGTNALEGALALATINDLKRQSSMNMILALCSVVYISVNIICIVLNTFDNDDPAQAACTPYLFHMLEFWGTFCFNVVVVFALIYSPKRLSRITCSPLLLKLVIFVNVAGSFTSASLISINLEKFEVASHELEYSNELTVSLFDLLLLGSLLRGMNGERLQKQKASLLPSFGTVSAAFLIAVFQLWIYNGMGWTEDGDSKGEHIAHYFEFVFQIISGGITFWFTMDNKLVADAKIRQVFKAVGDVTLDSESADEADESKDGTNEV